MVDSSNTFLPSPIYQQNNLGIKVATPDLILNDDVANIDAMTDLIFEDIGGQEILGLSNYDNIGNPDGKYDHISNLGSIYSQFNSLNILTVGDNSSNIFNSFAISLNAYAPQSSGFMKKDNNGNIILSFVNLSPGLYVEVEFMEELDYYGDINY